MSPLLVEQLIDSLQQLNKNGLSILVVEQDLVVALEISTTAYAIDMGKIVKGGKSSELLHDPAIRKAYLGSLVT